MPNENAIPETHIRLVATPTAGVPAEHSPYYRRLVSAGYKGYLQGNIAGASLYGALGGIAGLIGAFAISVFLPPVGVTAFAAVPLLAGYGLIKGSSTFGQIGSNAAQLAEYAEMNERRNALLDRLYETPSKEEAAEIRKLLQADGADKPPEKLIHFRTALIGALIGALAVAALVGFGGTMLAGTALGHSVIGAISPLLGEGAIVGAAGSETIAAAFLPKVLLVTGTIGAALGSMIGIDRGWIRRWFDVSEGAVHERDYYDRIAQQRTQEISRLHRIGQNEMREIANNLQRGDELPGALNVVSSPSPIENTVPATERLDTREPKIQPPTKIATSIETDGRIQELQRAASPV